MDPRTLLVTLIVAVLVATLIIFGMRRGSGNNKGKSAGFSFFNTTRRKPTRRKVAPPPETMLADDDDVITAIPRHTQRVRPAVVDRSARQLTGMFGTISRRTSRPPRPTREAKGSSSRNRFSRIGTGIYSNVSRRNPRQQRSRVLTLTDEELLSQGEYYDDAPSHSIEYADGGFDLPQNLNEIGAINSPRVTASRAYTEGGRFVTTSFETTGRREFVERGTDVSSNYDPFSTFDYMKYVDKAPTKEPDFEIEYSDRPYTSFFSGILGSGIPPFMGYIYERTESGREFKLSGDGHSNGHNGNGVHMVGYPGTEELLSMEQLEAMLGEVVAGGVEPKGEMIPPPETPIAPQEKLVPEPLFNFSGTGLVAFFTRTREQRRRVRREIIRHPFAPFHDLFIRRNRFQVVIVSLASVFILFGIITGLLYLGRQIDRAPTDKFSVVMGRIGEGDTYQTSELGREITQGLEAEFTRNSGVVGNETLRSDQIVSSRNQAINEQNRTKADLAVWGYYDPTNQLLHLQILLKPNGPFDLQQGGRREMERYFFEPDTISLIFPMADTASPTSNAFARLMGALSSYYDGNWDTAVARFTELSRLLGNYNRPEIHVFQGNALYLYGSYDAALREYEAAQQLVSDLTARQENPNVEIDQIVNNRAIIYMAQNKFNEANSLLANLAGAHPFEARYISNYVALQYEMAGLSNNPTFAAELATRLRPATDLNSQNWAASYYLGQLYRILGDWDTADKFLSRAETLRPDFAPADTALGMNNLDRFFIQYKGRTPTAESNALLDKSRSQFQTGLGLATGQRSSFIERANALRQTQGKEALSPALERMGRLSLQEVNDATYGEARDVLERGRLEGNKVGGPLDQVMRWVKGEKTALEDARDRFIQITNDRKDFADGYFFLGESYYLLGDTGSAYKNFDAAKSKQAKLLYYTVVADHLAAENKPQEAAAQIQTYINANANASSGYVALAQLYLNLKQPQNALNASNAAIKRNAKDSSAYLIAARSLTALGRFPEASSRFGEAYQLDQNNSDIAYERGLALYQAGNGTDAIESLQQAINMKPGAYPGAHYTMGLIYLGMPGNSQQAINELEKAITEKDNYPEAWFKLGEVYFQLNRLEDARRAYAKVLDYDANNYTAAYRLALLLEQAGQGKEAEARYRQALKIQPGLLNGYTGLSHLLASYSDDKSRDEAINLAWTALSMDRGSPEANYALGNALFQRNLYNEAISAYGNVINLKRDYAPAYYGRAQAYRAANLLDNALTDINQALKLSASDPNYYLLQAQILQGRGNGEEALNAYDLALQYQLADPGLAYQGIGDIYFVRTQYSVAESNYLKALAANPDLIQASYQLASIYFLRGDVNRAIGQFEKVVKKQENQALAWYYLGSLYTRQDRTDDAMKAYQNAVKYDNNRVEPHYELGNTYRVKGLRSDSIKQYDEASRLNPNFYPAYLQKGLTYEELGQPAEARQALNTALKSQDPLIRQQASDALVRIGRQ